MLEKSIVSGKEKRKPYVGAKRVSKSCRNNGGCPYCEGNRMHKNTKRVAGFNDKLADLDNGQSGI